MKTVGIIGGLGPETTAKFYLELIFGCYKKNKIARPPILLWNIPLDYKIEQDLLIKSIGEERYIPYLIDAARRLEKGGADFLVMPCNSLHIYIDMIRTAVKIPVLNIVEETVKFLEKKNVDKVGLLATTSLIKHGLYQNILNKAGIKDYLPDKNDQNIIGDLISNLVLNNYNNKDKEQILKVISKFKVIGLNTIILACTDLQLLIPKYPQLEIYDTMKILADSTVEYM
jgi:aspartate racemase